MKEITRIHIAKTPYEVETAAKKELEAYISSLEAYNIDAEIIEDIEVRITEILAERGVKRDGVISAADVKVLKKQLGAPEDFMADGDIAIGPDETETSDGTPRKLYRDTENAVIGGVLAGIAAFFKVNPLWVRLVFILLALASFGTMILVYAVLWIAVPEAKTAADKLQMAGRPVTVKSIREQNEIEATKSSRGGADGRRVLTVLAGVICVFGAFIAASITVFAAFAMLLSGRARLSDVVMHSGYLLPAYILAIVSGLLLVALFILGAYAAFAQKMTRRVIVSICVVVTLGLASFGSAGILTYLGGTQLTRTIEANTREVTLKMPAAVSKMTALSVRAKGVHVQYIASKSVPKATLRALAKDNASMPDITLAMRNGMLSIDAQATVEDMCLPRWGCGGEPTVTVYGPALSQLTAGEGSSVKYEAADQNDLTLTAQGNADISVTSGGVENVTITAERGANVSVADATIQHLMATVKTSSQVDAGTVQTLTLNDQESSCPAHAAETYISVWRVASGSMTINGKKRDAKTNDSGCVALTIESEEN